MWIFLNNAFLSVVSHKDRPDSLLVRGRVAGDIERVLPRAKVTFTPEHDYAYRAVVPRKQFAQVLAQAAEAIDYPNFKNSVEEFDRHEAYMEVWSRMQRLQVQHHQSRKRLHKLD